MRFVLIKGQSQYGSLRLHIDQLAQAFRDLGHEVEVVDLTLGGLAALDRTVVTPPDAYLAINGVGSDYANANGSVYDQIGAAYVTLHVDHPVHQAARITTRFRKHAAFCLDRSHVQFVSAWPSAKGLAHLGFLPPGAGAASALGQSKVAPGPHGNRPPPRSGRARCSRDPRSAASPPSPAPRAPAPGPASHRTSWPPHRETPPNSRQRRPAARRETGTPAGRCRY